MIDDAVRALAQGKNFAALTIWDATNPYSFAEVRGRVVETMPDRQIAR